jgi:hypothetical protein
LRAAERRASEIAAKRRFREAKCLYVTTNSVCPSVCHRLFGTVETPDQSEILHVGSQSPYAQRFFSFRKNIDLLIGNYRLRLP